MAKKKKAIAPPPASKVSQMDMDAVDTIANTGARIRRLAALIANISDNNGWRDEDLLDDDALQALGDLAEIIGDDARTIIAAGSVAFRE